MITEYNPLVRAAMDLIETVMEAGRLQKLKENKPTDGWKHYCPDKRTVNAHMHFTRCVSSIRQCGRDLSVTDNTRLPDYMHGGMNAIIIHAIRKGFIEPDPVLVIDTTQDEVAGE